MAHPILTRLMLAVSGAAVAAGCGGSDDTSAAGQTSPGSAGAGGGTAGSGGTVAAGSGGTTTAGAGGATTGGSGGTTTAGSGGATMAGAGGATMAGAGGAKAGAGGAKAGAGGTTTAGAGGAKAGAGGFGGGGATAGSGGATAGSGGATAGSGGATSTTCVQGGDCVKTAWCSTSTLPESYCECVGDGAYQCGAQPTPFSTITVCIDPNADGSCPPLGDATLYMRINAEYVSASCGAFAQSGPESKTTTAGAPKCCFGVITDACVGRPMFVADALRVAAVARRADWS